MCTLICFHISLGHLDLHYPHWAIDERVIDASGVREILVKSTFVCFKGLAPIDFRLSLFDAHPDSADHEIRTVGLAQGLVPKALEMLRAK